MDENKEEENKYLMNYYNNLNSQHISKNKLSKKEMLSKLLIAVFIPYALEMYFFLVGIEHDKLKGKDPEFAKTYLTLSTLHPWIIWSLILGGTTILNNFYSVPRSIINSTIGIIIVLTSTSYIIVILITRYLNNKYKYLTYPFWFGIIGGIYAYFKYKYIDKDLSDISIYLGLIQTFSLPILLLPTVCIIINIINM